MNQSPLQKARYQYSPKLPGMLRNGISEICVKEGNATQSVADQEKIAALFPNTYGEKEITFEKGENTSAAKKQVVGVILSGGQAPGGHRFFALFDNNNQKPRVLQPLFEIGSIRRSYRQRACNLPKSDWHLSLIRYSLYFVHFRNPHLGYLHWLNMQLKSQSTQ